MGGSRFRHSIASGAGINFAPELKLQTYQLQSYHTLPEIASFLYSVTKDDAALMPYTSEIQWRNLELPIDK